MVSVSTLHELSASLEHERENVAESKLVLVEKLSIAPSVCVLDTVIVARVRVIVVSMTVLGMTL